MTIQDPTITRAELAIEEAELIDGGPAVSWGAIMAGAVLLTYIELRNRPLSLPWHGAPVVKASRTNPRRKRFIL